MRARLVLLRCGGDLFWLVGWVFLACYDSCFSQVFDSFSICLMFFFCVQGCWVLIWLFWEHGFFSGAWAAQLCGSSVFLWFLGPSWCFSGSKGCHWELFFEPRGSLGRYVEGLGVPLGGFGAQSLLKTASLFHARYFFSGFGAKLGTGKVSTCSPKPNKKTVQNSINKSIRFWIVFLLDFCRFLV